eukprot:g1315.t1
MEKKFSVKELRAALDAKGIDYRGVLEKAALRDLVEEAYSDESAEELEKAVKTSHANAKAKVRAGTAGNGDETALRIRLRKLVSRRRGEMWNLDSEEEELLVSCVKEDPESIVEVFQADATGRESLRALIEKFRGMSDVQLRMGLRHILACWRVYARLDAWSGGRGKMIFCTLAVVACIAMIYFVYSALSLLSQWFGLSSSPPGSSSSTVDGYNDEGWDEDFANDVEAELMGFGDEM